MKKTRRLRLKLLPKFIISLAILGIVLTVVISIFSYVNSGAYLEKMYAQRVVFGAKSIAAMMSVDDVKTIIAPGGRSDRGVYEDGGPPQPVEKGRRNYIPLPGRTR